MCWKELRVQTSLSLDPAHISKRLLRFVHTHPYQASKTADAFLKGWEVVDVGTVMKTGEMVRDGG